MIASAACRRSEVARVALDSAAPTFAIERDATSIAKDASRIDAATPVDRIDTPAWPDGTTKFLITWVIYPVVMRADIPTRHIEVVIRGGAIARHFSTQDAFSVTYAIEMQARCQASLLGESMVAELYMNGGGNSVFRVDHVNDELVIEHETGTDGHCEPDPCETTSTVLARIPVPSHATFEERFHVVDDASHEHDEACAADSLRRDAN